MCNRHREADYAQERCFECETSRRLNFDVTYVQRDVSKGHRLRMEKVNFLLYFFGNVLPVDDRQWSVIAFAFESRENGK